MMEQWDIWDSEYIHESELQKYEDVKWHLSELVKSIYETGDLIKLENSLEEVCAVFEMKLPAGELKIRRTRWNT